MADPSSAGHPLARARRSGAHSPIIAVAVVVVIGFATTVAGAADGAAPELSLPAPELSRPAPDLSRPAPDLSLPFEGIWGVIQGFDSGDTHTGYAAFALDFAPPQPGSKRALGRLARARHPRLTDFSCYGRPVVAPADGTVVRVAAGFRDLPPYAGAKVKGGGNFVIIQHAPAVYTELVHLQAGSVRVAVGDAVRRGQPIARCGNSGNATTPHLHLGLLTSISPITTGRMKLAHYEVLGPGDRWIPGDGEPQQGQWLRPSPARQPPP